MSKQTYDYYKTKTKYYERKLHDEPSGKNLIAQYEDDDWYDLHLESDNKYLNKAAKYRNLKDKEWYKYKGETNYEHDTRTYAIESYAQQSNDIIANRNIENYMNTVFPLKAPTYTVNTRGSGCANGCNARATYSVCGTSSYGLTEAYYCCQFCKDSGGSYHCTNCAVENNLPHHSMDKQAAMLKQQKYN
ncbi:hypothetical protein ABK040_009217 [Willaertia magna]